MPKVEQNLPAILTCPCGVKAPLQAAHDGYGKLYKWCWICPDCQVKFEHDLKLELEGLPF